ncbi:hypothetical protein Tco_1348862 [Tanacetum coccineum]
MYGFKEYSSCGAWYNKSCGCSKGGFVDKFVLDHNKTPDSSQRPFIFEKNCPECGDPVEGLYCRQCALIRKKLEEVFQDFQDTSESSNDNPNVVNVPQEPFVLNQDPGENPSQSPPHIDHNCCYECGDSLDRIFCQRCTCESCGKGAHYGYNFPPKVSIISNLESCFNQNVDEFHKLCHVFIRHAILETKIRSRMIPILTLSMILLTFSTHPHNHRYILIPICYDDDDNEYSFATQECLKKFSSAITPDLPKSNSLIMEDKHLDTIPEPESDKLIKSSVEDLIHTPSEFEDECDYDESSHEEVIHEMSFKTYSNPLFDLDEEIISSEFNPNHNEDLDSTPKNDRFDTESYLLKSLLNRDTLMASSPKIDSLFDEFTGELITIPPRIVNREHEEYISLMERLLYDNSSPRPPEDFHANPNTIIESLPTFPIPVEDSDSLREEISIFPGLDDSIPSDIESDDYDSKDSTIDVVDDILVDVPYILTTHPTLHMDFDFIPSHNDLGSDLDVSSPSGDRSKIYDPGICIEVESTRILATLSPVIDTLLPFSSKNEDKVFNHGVLASKEKSPPSSSHRGFKASKLFH